MSLWLRDHSLGVASCLAAMRTRGSGQPLEVAASVTPGVGAMPPAARECVGVESRILDNAFRASCP